MFIAEMNQGKIELNQFCRWGVTQIKSVCQYNDLITPALSLWYPDA